MFMDSCLSAADRYACRAFANSSGRLAKRLLIHAVLDDMQGQQGGAPAITTAADKDSEDEEPVLSVRGDGGASGSKRKVGSGLTTNAYWTSSVWRSECE
jgi:hypothetical protein